MKNKKRWKKVGTFDVDAGLCWIGDPCYIIGNDELDYPYLNWNDFCNELFKKDKKGVAEWKHNETYTSTSCGKGLTIQTGYGDGEYPVYVKRNTKGVIIEVRIVFSEE